MRAFSKFSTAIFIVASALLLTTPASRGGSIFDDDYTPPKRAEAAPEQPAPATPARHDPVPVAPPAVVTRPTPAPTVPPVASVSDGVRHALPDRASRVTCRKLFEEVFEKELKDLSPASRKKFAQRLIDEAMKCADGSADRFVLLCGALGAGEQAYSLHLSFTAAEDLAKSYEVDEMATKVEAAIKVFSGPPSPMMGSVYNVDGVFRVADWLISQEDFGDLSRLEGALQHGAPSIPDPELKLAAQNQIRDMLALCEARYKAKPAFDMLKKMPNDAVANAAAGSYLCFQQGNWEAGLPKLAKSNDPVLKALATAELNRPSDPNAVVAVADGWWDARTKMSETDCRRAYEHAADLYRSVEPNLTGLKKLAVDKRMAQIANSARHRRIDLLDLFQPTAGAVRGTWHMQDGVLACDLADDSRAEFPYEPPDEYDFKISFTVSKPTDSLIQVCCFKDRRFMFVMGGYGNRFAGFANVNGAPVNQAKNGTGKQKDHWLVDGRRYVEIIKVRKQGLEAYLDGQLITAVLTDYSNLDFDPYFSLADPNVLGVCAFHESVRFDLVEVIEISGEGKILSGK